MRNNNNNNNNYYYYYYYYYYYRHGQEGAIAALEVLKGVFCALVTQ